MSHLLEPITVAIILAGMVAIAFALVTTRGHARVDHQVGILGVLALLVRCQLLELLLELALLTVRLLLHLLDLVLDRYECWLYDRIPFNLGRRAAVGCVLRFVCNVFDHFGQVTS